jgi:hypothetical protein
METIGDFLNFLAGKTVSHSTISWPPDAFACAASLLERSGGYLAVLAEWPPGPATLPAAWASDIESCGRQWRQAAAEDLPPPSAIQESWNIVLASLNNSVQSLAVAEEGSATVRTALLQILAAADEACEGIGIPGGEIDEFENQSLGLLLDQQISGAASTLCREISTVKLSVLPKLHTPQTGITIRSLSHNLALCPVSEVKPRWTWANHPGLGHDRHGLNVLVVPWPLDIDPSAFRSAIPRTGRLANMDSSLGFFEYAVRGGKPLDLSLLETLITNAISMTGSVDVIVFPELALVPSDIEPLASLIARLNPRPILIGGICHSVTGGGMCRNSSVTIVPLESGQRVFALSQDKHHRWLLDGNQVKQYGLGGVLDPTINWWEHTLLSRRELGFLSLQPWLTLCTLICEDLARPDPIANLVRAVGPNMIIALLMDGPQLSSRWPARYGTVLADDPGSSVLTISALGMVKLSRPRGMAPSNIVALWKDAYSGGPTELALPSGHQALLLSLTRVWRKEFSADGRHDRGNTSYLTLSGIHPISG